MPIPFAFEINPGGRIVGDLLLSQVRGLLVANGSLELMESPPSGGLPLTVAWGASLLLRQADRSPLRIRLEGRSCDYRVAVVDDLFQLSDSRGCTYLAMAAGAMQSASLQVQMDDGVVEVQRRGQRWLFGPLILGEQPQTLETIALDQPAATLQEPGRDLLWGCWALLRKQPGGDGFLSLLQEVYGITDAHALALRDQVLEGSRLGLTFVVLDPAAMNGALGGYSAEGTGDGATIYLNAELLAPQEDPRRLLRVALEEVGHHLDHLLKGEIDTAGDEGALFASLLLGDHLNAADIAALRNENDAGFVMVSGRTVAVENAASSISTSVTSGTTLNASTATAFSYTVTINSTANNGADLLVAAYSTSSGALIGWQVVNRATNLQSTTYTGSFNFTATGVTRVDATTITLRAWQGTAGTAYGTGNNRNPVISYGSSTILSGAASGFAANSTTAPGGTTSLDLTRALSSTPSGYAQQALNITIDTLVPTLTATISAIIDDRGLITGTVASGGRTDDNSLQLSGTLGGPTAGAALATGETLRVYDGTTLLGNATVTVVAGGQSSWTYSDGRTLSNNQALSYSVRVMDAAGNLGPASSAYTATVDTAAPTLTAAVTAVSDNVGQIQGTVSNGGRSDDTALTVSGTVSGTLASGDTVRVYDGTTLLGSAIVSGSTWSYSDGRTLSDGQVVSYTARVADLAGNTGTAGSAYSVTIDTTAPTLTGTITGLIDNVGNITGTVPSGGFTDDTSLQLRGTLGGPTAGAALATGETLRIYDGTTLLGNATVTVVAGGQSSWTYSDGRTLSNNQALSYSVRVMDAAGNLGPASAAYTATIDTASPTVTAVALTTASGAQGNWLNAGDMVTARVTFSEAVTVSGSPSLGLNINGSVVQAAYSSGSGTAQLLFTYTILAGQGDGNGISINASSLSLNSGTIRDRSGLNAILTHAAVADNSAYLVDAVAPAAPVLQLADGVSGGATAAEATQGSGVVSVAAEVGAALAVSLVGAGGGTLSRSLTASGSAQAIVLSATDLVTLGEGTVVVTATASDPAGNTSAVGTISFVLDTQAPLFSSGNTAQANENVPAGMTVYTAVSTDISPVSYSLGGADAAAFSLNGATGVLTINACPDYETRTSYDVTITAYDSAGNSSNQALVINIADVIEVSSLTIGNLASSSVHENTPYTSATPTLTGAIGAVTWSLEGDDASRFSINSSTGVVSMVARDFEVPVDTGSNNSYAYTLRATDSDGNTTSQAVVVTITDVIEPVPAGPTLVSSTPTDGSLDVEISQNLSFQFSEPVTAGIGSLSIVQADGLVVESFDLASSPRVSFNGATLTINPTWALPSSSDLFIRIDPGAVRDSDGNFFTGLQDSSRLNFRTGVETINGDAEEFTFDNFPGTSNEAIGDHRMLFIRTTYADQLNAPWAKSAWLEDMAGLDAFWARNSFGKMHLSSIFTPLITLNQTTAWMRDLDTGDGYANFGTDRGNNNSAPWNFSIAIARQLGYVRSNVQAVAVGNDDWTRSGASWGGGDFIFNGWTGMSLMAHEGGHEIGLGHARWLNADGTLSEYGNDYDVMGDGYDSSDHYGLQAKLSRGWLSANQIVTNPVNGIYRIDAHDLGVQQNDHIYGLEINAGGQSYSFEYRALIQDGRINRSLLVLRKGDNALLDATADTVNVKTDAGIDIGRTYQVPGSATYVTVLSQGDGFLDVAVQNGPFASNVAPAASFTASASQVQARDQVTFSATAADANGDGLTYFWWFSDGVVGSGPSFTRRFSQTTAATVTARLTVSDLRGGSAVLETPIAVGAASTGTPVTVGSVTPISTSKPLVSLVASDAFAQEGGSDNGQLLISRQGTDLSAPLVVQLTVAGTGLNDVTAASRPASVTIAAGESQVLLPIAMLDDAVVESVKQLSVSLVSNAAYDISSQNASASVTLADDDHSVVSIQAIDAVASESGRDSGAFLISRSGPTTAALKVYYSPFGSAFNGADFLALNGEVTIAAGESSAVVLVQPLDDPFGEPTEQLSLQLASFSSAYDVNPRASMATVSLLDNDNPLVSVSSDVNPSEGGANGQFLIEAQGRVGATVTVGYTLSGTASAGSDYLVPAGSATITIGANGRGTASVTIPVLDDALVEQAELLLLTLTESSSYQLDDDRMARLVISDNDSSRPVVMVSAFGDAPREGGTDVTSEARTGQGRFYIQRSTSTGALTVNYFLGGSATAGSDYTGLVSGSVTIADGAPGAIVRFTPVDDAFGEGSESVTLTLTPDSAYSLGVVSSANLWIGDNDIAPVTVDFDSLQTRIAESQDGLGNVRDLVVKLSAAATAPVSVTAVVSDGTAHGDNIDWTFLDPATNTPIQTPTLTFAPGEIRKTVRLRVNPDRQMEASEWSQISLINPTGATLTSNASNFRLDIDDRPSGGDEANRYIRLLSTGSVRREDAGSDPLLMVALDRPAGSTPISVTLQLSGSATLGQDFSLSSTTLTFQPGELSKAVPLSLLSDASAETVENIRVTLGNAKGAIITGPAYHDIVLVDSQAPVVASASGRVSSSQGAGTVISSVSAAAAAGRNISQWQILAGNAIRDGQNEGAFSIDANGQVLLSNPASLPLGPTLMQLIVRATDNLGAASDGVVNLEVNGQRVLSETRWSGSGAFTNQDWSGTPIYSGLLTSSATASNVGDDYSRRITGLLEPSNSGTYTFWISGDDDCRLYLGTDAGEASRVLIASVTGYSSVQQWDKYPEQQSNAITLQAGQRYWLEVQQRDGSGGDHVEVAWQGPGMASKALIGSANFGTIVTGASQGTPPLATSYPATVEIALINPTIGTDTGVTATISSGGSTRDATLQLSGTASAGSTVQLFDGSTLLGSAVVSGSLWTFTTPSLSDGQHSLLAQVRDPAGNIRITAPVQALINSELEVAPHLLLSHDSTPGNLSSSGTVASVERLLSRGDGLVLFKTADASKYGNGGTSFSDGNTTTPDLILADGETGTQQLINRGFVSATSSSNQNVTLSGITADGRSVVFSSSAVTSFGNNNSAFSDGNATVSGTSDLFVYDRSSNAVKLATWSGSQTNSTSRNASFVGLSADNQTLVFRSDYAQKIGSFSRGSSIADSTASADLLTYNLSSGAQLLLTHGAASTTQSLGAGVGSTVLLSNDGQYALFTANDANKLGNGGSAFGDSAPANADLFAARLSDGQLRLLSAGVGSGGSSSAGGGAVTLLGQSGDGSTAIFSTADATVFGFNDAAPASADLFAVNIANGAIRLLNHAVNDLNTTTASNPSFVQAIGDFVYFTVANATSLGASSDGDTTKADLYRANVVTGDVQLLSFQQNNSGAAMNGSYATGSLLVSGDNRYVAFAYNVPISQSGGLNFTQAGDGVFVVDTQAGTIKLVNWSSNQTRGSYGFWAGARAKAFTANSSGLIVESSYLSWTGNFSGSGQYDKGLFSFDLATGAQTLLTRSPSSGTSQAAATAYRGISGDGRRVFFTTADASKFGNAGATFSDGAPSADDLLSVTINASEFELISGLNGSSFGSAVTMDGLSDSGRLLYRSNNVVGMPSGPGLLSDANASGADLLATSTSLLDLDTAGDTSGGAAGTTTDNITSATNFTLRARVLPNQAVQLLDDGSPVSGGAATADSRGLVSWTLNGVALGTHHYSLLDTVEQIPVVMSGRPSATRLEVNVIATTSSLANSFSLNSTASLFQSRGTSSPSLAESDGLAPAMPQTGTTPSGSDRDLLTDWTPVEGTGVPGPSDDTVMSWSGGALNGNSLYPMAYIPPQLDTTDGSSVFSGATLDRPPWLAPIGLAPDVLALTS